MCPAPARPTTALVADDEPLLRAELVDELRALWPALHVVAEAADGQTALAACEAARPDIAFLDIRMPGLTGLEVAQQLQARGTLPAVVFVTAYDQFAIEAFERAAFDYLLKPVRRERLAATVNRLQQRLADPTSAPDLDAVLAALRQALPGAAPPTWLHWVRAAVGDTVRLIAVEDVVYFAATDKYVAVFTREGESLLRTPLRELGEQLDPAHFQQIHRGVIVNLRHVRSARTDGNGRAVLSLDGRPETLLASRRYAHLFRPM